MAIGDHVVGASYSLGLGVYLTIQPASGEVWIVDQIWSSNIVSDGPNVEVYLYDGTNSALMAMPEVDLVFGWPFNFVISNSIYLRIKAVVGQSIGYHATIVGDSTTAGPGECKTILSSTATGSLVSLQPPAGEVWAMSVFGVGTSSSDWNGSGTTAYPKMTFKSYDGATAADIFIDRSAYNRKSNPKGWHYFDNTSYIRYAQATGGVAYVGLCIIQVQ